MSTNMLLQEEIKPIRVEILPQPNDVTCGPTCLHAVYNYFGDTIDLSSVIKEVKQFKGGGTLAVMLGNHALKRGYKATIYTYNLHIFDLTWFKKGTDLSAKLEEQTLYKNNKKIRQTTKAYQEFLHLGGKIHYEELSPSLIKKFLIKGLPILTGLSATYLYQNAREIPETNQYHDTKGEPVGHFVIINAFDTQSRKVSIADPLNPNPISDTNQYYTVNLRRVINSILLGIVTYDANLLIIQKKSNV